MRGSAAWDQWLREESTGVAASIGGTRCGNAAAGLRDPAHYGIRLGAGPSNRLAMWFAGHWLLTGGAAMDRAAAASITGRAGRTAFGEVAIVGAIGGGGVAVGGDDTPIANQKGARHLANVAPRCPERVAL